MEANIPLDQILQYKRDFEETLEKRKQNLLNRMQVARTVICKECNRPNLISLDPIQGAGDIKCSGSDCDAIIYKLVKPAK